MGEDTDEVGLSDAGRSEKDNVLLHVVQLGHLLAVALAVFTIGLCVFELVGAPGMVVVVADGDGQGALGFILPDDVPIQVLLDLGRLHVEAQDRGASFSPCLFLLGGRLGLRGGAHAATADGRDDHILAEFALEELVKVFLNLLRSWRALFLFFFVAHGSDF